MNTEVNQKISQLLDDELHTNEEEFVLRKIAQQTELKNKMDRYVAVSQVFKTDHFNLAKAGFLESINQQLKDDPVYFLPQKKRVKKSISFWPKTSLAIAASVAVVAVVIPRQAEFQNPVSVQSQSKLQHTVSKNKIALVEKKERIKNTVQLAKSQVSQHERFKAYLQAHSDDLYTHGSLNYQPYASVASFSGK